MCASPVRLAVFVLAVLFIPISARADYLKNADLKEGLAGWRGDGAIAYLNPDGTEGAEGDKDVVPVIKVVLSRSKPRMVYQEFEAADNPKTLHYKVDILASGDFQRSKNNDDYTHELIDYTAETDFIWNVIGICNADFWIRAGPAPEWHFKLAKTQAGNWVTVKYSFTNTFASSKDLSVFFCVPPGTGTLYLKNPAAFQ